MAAAHRLVACALLAAAECCHAEHEEDFIADKLVVQYAGMVGMISLGVENTTAGHVDYQLLVGYTPQSAAGVEIYSVGAKANYVFDPLTINQHAAARIYTGMGLYYYFGEQYQHYDYPKDYYTHPATEWHLMPYLGIRISGHNPAHSDLTLYAEAGIIDAYLIHYYNNSQTLGLSDVVSLALGVSIPLR